MRVEDEVDPPRRGPRTINVLALLAAAAAVFSYLGAFAVVNALVAAGLLDKWPPDRDPRLRWMLLAFASLIGAFLLVALLFKWTSWRQTKRLDSLSEADSETDG